MLNCIVLNANKIHVSQVKKIKPQGTQLLPVVEILDSPVTKLGDQRSLDLLQFVD